MSMKIITGSTGQKHVTSNNDGEFNAGIYAEKTVLQLGNCLKATLVDNNTITIADGDLIFQGRHALIEPDTTETITISTGQIGFNRLDLIVAKYKLDTSTGYESLELEVLEGSQSAGDPVLPAIATGDIRKGATEVDFPLYQVKIEGVTITEVKKLFKERSESIADEILSAGKKIEALNSNLTELTDNKLVYNAVTDKIDVYSNGVLVGSLNAGFQNFVMFDNGVLGSGISLISNSTTTWSSSYPLGTPISITPSTKSIDYIYQQTSRSSFGYLSTDLSPYVGKTIYVTYNISGGANSVVSSVITNTDKYIAIGGNNWGTCAFNICLLSSMPNSNIDSIYRSIEVGTISSSQHIRVMKIEIK